VLRAAAGHRIGRGRPDPRIRVVQTEPQQVAPGGDGGMDRRLCRPPAADRIAQPPDDRQQVGPAVDIGPAGQLHEERRRPDRCRVDATLVVQAGVELEPAGPYAPV
jgi:hypothetical protein